MVNPIKLTAVEENDINNGELIDSKKLKVNCSISTSAINIDNLSSHETITRELNFSSLSETIDSNDNDNDEFINFKSNLISASLLNVYDERVNSQFDRTKIDS